VLPIRDLRSIARARLRDAEVLSRPRCFDGSVYVCGYAIEIGLKARICRTLNWSDFPSTGGEFQAYRTFQTHELDVLLRLSGQEARIRQNHFASWNGVAIWRVESRYNVVGTAQQSAATAMIQAAEQLLVVL
jgi:hypothetical protein